MFGVLFNSLMVFFILKGCLNFIFIDFECLLLIGMCMVVVVMLICGVLRIFWVLFISFIFFLV